MWTVFSVMNADLLIPRSVEEAETAVRQRPENLSNMQKREFLRIWYSLFWLHPGLHPDGFEDADSGWPESLRPIASEAWSRYENDLLLDDEFYCYEAIRDRLESGLAAVGAQA